MVYEFERPVVFEEHTVERVEFNFDGVTADTLVKIQDDQNFSRIGNIPFFSDVETWIQIMRMASKLPIEFFESLRDRDFNDCKLKIIDFLVESATEIVEINPDMFTAKVLAKAQRQISFQYNYANDNFILGSNSAAWTFAVYAALTNQDMKKVLEMGIADALAVASKMQNHFFGLDSME